MDSGNLDRLPLRTYYREQVDRKAYTVVGFVCCSVPSIRIEALIRDG